MSARSLRFVVLADVDDVARTCMIAGQEGARRSVKQSHSEHYEAETTAEVQVRSGQPEAESQQFRTVQGPR